jgi:hypothetical protein
MKSSLIVTAAALTGVLCAPVVLMAAGKPTANTDLVDVTAIMATIKNKGDVFAGIRILDSLRVSGHTNEEFLASYAKYVFDAFMPMKHDSFPAFLKNADQVQPTDTAFPCSFRWRIVSSPQAQLPFFEYWAGFVFRKQFRPVFSGLGKHTRGQAWLRYQNHEPPTALSAELLGQLSDRIDSAWCTIHIDVNDTKISPYEYIIKRISGVYDSIEVKKDLSQYHAISLRCLSRGLFFKPEGASTAYIVFDRSARNISKNDPAARKLSAWKTDKTVRFTLTMRCGLDIQNAAEAKLQSILRAF